jgi:AcrB/AcrD/AcrF family
LDLWLFWASPANPGFIVLRPADANEVTEAWRVVIGVVVSHVIVLFDFIEEMHAKGEPLEQALPGAGIQRIRPVMITVGATILALFPLVLEGGPLWQPLCYAQIGGLCGRNLYHAASGACTLQHLRA